MHSYDGDPQEFVQENEETLVKIIKHSSDGFVRSLALAALLKYGTDPQLDDIERDLKQVKDERGGENR